MSQNSSMDRFHVSIFPLARSVDLFVTIHSVHSSVSIMFASLFGSRPAQPPALDSKELAKMYANLCLFEGRLLPLHFFSLSSRDKQLSTFFEEHRSAEALDTQRTKFRIFVLNQLGTLFVMMYQPLP
jgi:hypothetical protein